MSNNAELLAGTPYLRRSCPLCGSENRGVPKSRYSKGEWRLKLCLQCGLLYLENPPPWTALVNGQNWMQSFAAEKQRRQRRQPLVGRLRSAWKELRRRWLPRRKVEALVKRYIGKGNLVDVGCGTGALFSQLPATIVPYGIEIDADAVRIAQSRAANRGGKVLHADALHGLLALDKRSMDGVVMLSFLEHEVKALEVLQATKRVLRPSGAVVIKVPNFDCWNRRLQGDNWPGFRFPEHVHYFTPRTLSHLVKSAGLRVVRFKWQDRLPSSDNMWLIAAAP